ncbi:MAG: formate--tetrahydrofolate ligase, partial [Lachnospiraceae bacterium]|nr:formate--tetrahydrofolate ligase [Lachnospiraceae bacterium]
AVLNTLETKKSHFTPLYEDDCPIIEKIRCVAREIYGAADVVFAPAVLNQIEKLENIGYGSLPVCMAKTQYSLSDDPTLLGRPEDFSMNVREVYVSAGAGFVVVLTGAIMTMPGLPKNPAAYKIDVTDDGVIMGLF